MLSSTSLDGVVAAAGSSGSKNEYATIGGTYNWGRQQFDNENGYCGECSIQTLMLRFGVWIPQLAVRLAGSPRSKDLLLQAGGAQGNMTKAMNAMRIKYDQFRGSGYSAFVTWTKSHLQRGFGVIEVAYASNGKDSDYDHIMPLVGMSQDGQSFFVYSNYSRNAIQKQVSSYSCTRANAKGTYAQAGCIPANTKYGAALLGTSYTGIGPPVSLNNLSNWSEGGANSSARPFTMTCDVVITGLTVGGQYQLYQVTSPGQVPTSTSGRVGGTPVKTFAASGASQTFRMSFNTANPTYFICTKA